jgi:hypothetical protein
MAIEKVIEIKVDAKDAVKQLDNINNELLEQKKITIELERELEKLEQQLKDTPKNSLSAQKKLREQIDHVKTSLKDQRTSVKELGVQKQELTNTVKKLNSEQKELGKDLKDNNGSLAVNSELISGLDKASGGLYSKFNTLISGVANLSKGFFTLRGAIMSTGIGALIILIGSLASAFTSSESGQNKFAKIMAVIKSVVGNVMDVISDLGEIIIGVFSGDSKAIKSATEFGKKIFDVIGLPIKNAIDIVKTLASVLGSLFSGDIKGAIANLEKGVANVKGNFTEASDAIKSATNSLKEFGKEALKEAKIAQDIADSRAKADKTDRDLLVKRAEADRKIAELREKAVESEKYSTSERIKMLEEAQQIENAITQQEIYSAKLRAKAKTDENALSKSTKEDLLEEENLKAKVIQLETARLQGNRRLTSQLNSLRREETNVFKQEADKRAEIARGEVEKLRNIYQEYEKKIQDINAKSEEEKTALERKRAEVAIDQVETDETKKEIARQKVKEYYDIIEAERQTKLVEAERVKQEQIKAIEDEFSMRKAEEANLTEEERLAFELQKVEIEKQKKILELDNLKATEEQKLEVLAYYKQREDKLNDDFTKAELARQKLVNKQKLDLTKSTFGALATILGENSKAGKLFASGQALMNTWQGVTEVLSNKTTLPEPFGTINKVASTGAVISSGLKAVQQINSVKTLGGGGGGQSGGGASPQITPPSFNIVQGTGTNQIAESIANANQKPVKAYVLSKDIKTNEALERNIQNSSEF